MLCCGSRLSGGGMRLADPGISRAAAHIFSHEERSDRLGDMAVTVRPGRTAAAPPCGAAAVPGVRGVMMTFDDFVIGMEQFGTRILPQMRCRNPVNKAA